MKCECAASGFCPRRNAHVPRHQWRQCQAGEVEHVDRVIASIQRRRQEAKKMEHLDALKLRIERRKQASARAKAWVMFFRTSEDSGLGDTVTRLLKACDNDSTKVDLRKRLRAITAECSCSRNKAIEKLNEQYPYTG